MGSIARFDLGDLRRRFDVSMFVETGTGRGDGLAFAAAARLDGTDLPLFDLLRSCEVDPAVADRARERFASDPRVEVFRSDSATFLDWACRMLPRDRPVLFWLDAHFPGADHGGKPWDAEKDLAVRLPLALELAIIELKRPRGMDVVVCDDLRVYEDGPYGHNNVPPELRPMCPADRSTGFVESTMGRTHRVERLYEHEGYLLLTPKGGDA